MAQSFCALCQTTFNDPPDGPRHAQMPVGSIARELNAVKCTDTSTGKVCGKDVVKYCPASGWLICFEGHKF